MTDNKRNMYITRVERDGRSRFVFVSEEDGLEKVVGDFVSGVQTLPPGPKWPIIDRSFEGHPPITPTVGDILVSVDALPDPDYVVDPRPQGGWGAGETIHVDSLLRYLGFLELVVINERVVACGLNVFRELPEEVRLPFESFRMGPYRDDVSRPAFELLTDLDVYKPVSLVQDTMVQSANELGEKWRSRYDEVEARYSDAPIDVAKERRRAWLADEVGVPLVLSQFSQDWGLPLRLGDSEVNRLRPIDDLEDAVGRGVIGYLKESLDRGSRELVDQLSAFRTGFDMPWTPISAQLIRDASGLESLARVALEYRDAYAGFRRYAVAIESELTSPDISLKQARRLLRELEEMSRELWPTGEEGLRKHVQRLTDLVASLPTSLAVGASTTEIVRNLLRQGPAALQRLSRRFKVRALIGARSDYLRGTDLTSEVARVCGVPVEGLKYSLLVKRQEKQNRTDRV
jgi:hypothetical protein